MRLQLPEVTGKSSMTYDILGLAWRRMRMIIRFVFQMGEKEFSVFVMTTVLDRFCCCTVDKYVKIEALQEVSKSHVKLKLKPKPYRIIAHVVTSNRVAK